MMHPGLLTLILAVAAVTYLLRAVPLALLRRPLENPRAVAFIGFLPYAILAAMVVPGIFSGAGSRPASLAGAVVAFALALWSRSLPVVAALAAAAAYAVSLWM
jgi:branched-subunit amino acid transport protein